MKRSKNQHSHAMCGGGTPKGGQRLTRLNLGLIDSIGGDSYGS